MCWVTCEKPSIGQFDVQEQKNSSCPRTEPLGTLHWTCSKLESKPFILKYCNWFCRYDKKLLLVTSLIL